MSANDSRRHRPITTEQAQNAERSKSEIAESNLAHDWKRAWINRTQNFLRGEVRFDDLPKACNDQADSHSPECPPALDPL